VAGNTCTKDEWKNIVLELYQIYQG
jgi:hypothetical protein